MTTTGSLRLLAYLSSRYHSRHQARRRRRLFTTLCSHDFINNSNYSNSNSNSDNQKRQFHSAKMVCKPRGGEEEDSLQIYDSLSGTIKPIITSFHDETTETTKAEKKKKALAWYTCGPTTYAPAHLGHARTYVWIDIIRRSMEYFHNPEDIKPLFVMNITDVDDKILAAASAAADDDSNNNNNDQEEKDPIALARKYEEEFWMDLDALNCLRPHVVTRVTECVESDIIPFIRRLVELGMAYQTNDGVYFDIRAYNDKMGKITKYGKLAPSAAAEDMVASGGSNQDDDDDNDSSASTSSSSSDNPKRDSRDFVLWKCKKDNESLFWSSPWGDGRPGWHIECSAMIESVQQKFIDSHQFVVHAGGIDLQFPHHTNEIAQSEAYLQHGQWINHWVHTGHLHIDGMKMSKSLKNFITIQEFFSEYHQNENKTIDDDDHDESPSTSSPATATANIFSSMLISPADDFRLWCLSLSGPYRGPATYSKDRLNEAQSVRQKIVRFLIDSEDWIDKSSCHVKVWTAEEIKLFDALEGTRRRGLGALKNDLDGSTFLKEILSLIEIGHSYMGQTKVGPIEPMVAVLATIRNLLTIVGFTERTTQAGVRKSGTTAAATHNNNNEMSSYCVGGEKAVIDTFVTFRSAIRQSALHALKKSKDNNNDDDDDVKDDIKTILQLCDETRDVILPKLGLQLQDGKDDEEDSWKVCLPTINSSDKNATKTSDVDAGVDDDDDIDLTSVPLQELFQHGQYKNQFSQYTKDGIPTHHHDGTEISKRLLKKLLKKYEQHQRRLND